MSTMRIDGRASAKLWAKRLAKLINTIGEDGGQVFMNTETNSLAVLKDGKTFTMFGEDVTSEL